MFPAPCRAGHGRPLLVTSRHLRTRSNQTRSSVHRSARMTAIVSEYIDETVFGGDSYVIRAEPSGMPRGVASLSTWVELVVDLRRLVTRDRTWTVLVRRRADDPFGVVIHEEVVVDEKRAQARVEEVAREIGSGSIPWAPSKKALRAGARGWWGAR